MRLTIKKILPALTVVAMLLAGVSCTKNDGDARIKFSLTDAPSMEYDAVNIDVQGIQVGVGNGENSEWVDLNILHPGVYNLLDYRNGEKIILADESFPAGKISQVRLILGDNNTVRIGTEEYPLTTPSAQQSGLKLNLHQVLEPEMMYSFVIDFDASRSVVKTGNEKYILKPVIRTFAETFGATLRGYVLPAEAKPYVEIIQDKDTLIALPETDGKFLFPGINGGVWKVNVVATDELNVYKDTTFFTEPVVLGKVADLGTITLKK